MRKSTRLAAGVLMAVLMTGAGFATPAMAGSSTASITIHQPTGFAGNYLASHFAQARYDWSRANGHLAQVLDFDPGNLDLIKRAMVLALGAGDMDVAAARAANLLVHEPENGLALLALGVQALIDGDHAQARTHLEAMPYGDLASFLKPLVLGWVQAEDGHFDEELFNDTTIHLSHAAGMLVMLGRYDDAGLYTRKLIETGSLGTYDAERVGDLLAILEQTDDALLIYQGVQRQGLNSATLNRKIDAIEQDDGTILNHVRLASIDNAAQGAALAMYDMAFVLFQEYSDTSAKIFAQMALALQPDMIEAKMLMGDTLARNGRQDEAIKLFLSIPADQPSYLVARRHAADLMAQIGRGDDAMALLNTIFTDYNDVEALIRIGDLHRQKERYDYALNIYNQAVSHIKNPVPEEYWYLLYARGMAYEREGQWNKAEADLKAALSFRPDNPYLLNYLGYGWADQGINLEESLALLERAVALRPGDGHITDSLGWVLYRMGRHDEAIPYLEKAVELLPYDPVINDHLGDAYWQVGRKVEARFQWERALNHSPEEAIKGSIHDKLANGLPRDSVRAASANVREAEQSTR